MNIRDSQILKMALPSIISNITVPLLGLVDLTIVGHLGRASYIGAIAVGTMIFNVIYWILGFLRMGTSGLTSQALGRRKLDDAATLLVNSMTIGAGMGILLMVFQVPVLHIALMVMSPSPVISSLVEAYFKVCIYGAPAMLGLYGLTGWFIGMQNTRIPMWVSFFQNLMNIAVSVLLTGCFGMKIEGVAWGTLVAQWSGFIVALCLWCIYYGRLRKHFTHLRVRMQFFVVNRDIFFRTLFLVAVNLFFTSAGARSGDTTLSANTLLMTMFTLFSYVMDGFAYSGEALCGKYLGAANKQAFEEIYQRLLWWGVLMVALFTLVYAVGGKLLLKLLTTDTTVLAEATRYLGWAVLIPVAGIAAFLYDGIFIGMTETRSMIVSTVVSACLFFAFYLFFMPCMGNHALWLAFLLFLFCRGVVLHLFFRNIRRNF